LLKIDFFLKKTSERNRKDYKEIKEMKGMEKKNYFV